MHGYNCVAGPDPSAIRERIRYDKDYSKPIEPVQDDRKFVTCTECRRGKKSCSLKSKFDRPPCKACEEDGIPCTFEALPRKKSSNNIRKNATKQKEAVSTSSGARCITTAFNHPIHFLHNEEGECTWCTRAIGIFGRGMREVLVTPSPDGLSYTELEGGENSSGKNDDYMCIKCTIERCPIIGCEGHELRPIDSINMNDIDHAGMFQRLANCEKPLPTDRWCAVCPAPALYHCCTPQNYDMWGEEVDPRSPEVEGCGLILCEECAVSFGELEDLEQVIDAAAAEPEIWILGVRADVEFLRRDGLLIRNVMAPVGNAAGAMEVNP
jgi:hypothetical protein